MRNPLIILWFLFLLLFSTTALPQSSRIDSMKQQLVLVTDDSLKMQLMGGIGFSYETLNVDSALRYDSAVLQLAHARQSKYKWAYPRALASISTALLNKGKFAEALDALFQSLAIAKENDIPQDIARAYRRLGIFYFQMENYEKSIQNSFLALQIDEKIFSTTSAAIDRIGLARAFEKINDLDSSAYYAERALQDKRYSQAFYQTSCQILGDVYVKKGDYARAMEFYQQGIEGSIINGDLSTQSDINIGIARLFIQKGEPDSAEHYAMAAFDNATRSIYKKGILASAGILAELYGAAQPAKALEYYKIMSTTKDSLFGVANIQTIQNLVEREDEKQREAEAASVAYRNRIKWIAVLAGLVTLLVIAFILFRSNSQKQKANVLLAQQKEKIETTLSELKAAQKQLIQSEKMASLGELTAGIAHEIQNPLNFVNNFSEVNTELLAELKVEISRGNIDEAKNIANDLIDNEQKINHHGKRADAIVKGMLQHSRISTGQKELTNINTLADEYLRLAYHGMRAKDNFFNVNIKTDFDQGIEKIKIIPQDIGRVILNLITNAFYAVNEKKKQQPDGYEPIITLSTKRLEDKVEIRVTDNGNGIPEKVLDKIFQPFFTTKPAGQGTGLGLSLSYDIVKAHGGELTVGAREHDYSEFSIKIPII